jgi:hypothetical protein
MNLDKPTGGRNSIIPAFAHARLHNPKPAVAFAVEAKTFGETAFSQF